MIKPEEIPAWIVHDDEKVLDTSDATFNEAGKVGVWTKADSITEFDELSASAP